MTHQMNTYMLPTDAEFVETIAKAIAKNRLYNDAAATMENMIGVKLVGDEKLEETFSGIFERLWAGTDPADIHQKDLYRQDAKSAIAAINLKLLTE